MKSCEVYLLCKNRQRPLGPQVYFHLTLCSDQLRGPSLMYLYTSFQEVRVVLKNTAINL